MGDVNARRIVFGTYVIPTQTLEAEETSIKHTEFRSAISHYVSGKEITTYGGKGVVSITGAQWGDEWSSMTHPLIQNWEEFTTAKWEDVLIHPGESGRITVSTTGILLDTSNGGTCNFLYIKNLGTDDHETYNDEVLVSLNGIGGNYYIIVPPGGSVHLRGALGVSGLSTSNIFVKCASGKTTQIEYLIAR